MFFRLLLSIYSELLIIKKLMLLYSVNNVNKFPYYSAELLKKLQDFNVKFKFPSIQATPPDKLASLESKVQLSINKVLF